MIDDTIKLAADNVYRMITYHWISRKLMLKMPSTSTSTVLTIWASWLPTAIPLTITGAVLERPWVPEPKSMG